MSLGGQGVWIEQSPPPLPPPSAGFVLHKSLFIIHSFTHAFTHSFIQQLGKSLLGCSGEPHRCGLWGVQILFCHVGQSSGCIVRDRCQGTGQ